MSLLSCLLFYLPKLRTFITILVVLLDAYSMSIRRCDPSDSATVIRLIHELTVFEKYDVSCVKMTCADLADHIEKKYCVAYIIECGGNAGYTILYPSYSAKNGDFYYMEDFYVSPDYRRMGYGTRLCNHIAAESRKFGYKVIRWNVLKWNEAAVSFYTKNDGHELQPTLHRCAIASGLESLKLYILPQNLPTIAGYMISATAGEKMEGHIHMLEEGDSTSSHANSIAVRDTEGKVVSFVTTSVACTTWDNLCMYVNRWSLDASLDQGTIQDIVIVVLKHLSEVCCGESYAHLLMDVPPSTKFHEILLNTGVTDLAEAEEWLTFERQL